MRLYRTWRSSSGNRRSAGYSRQTLRTFCKKAVPSDRTSTRRNLRTFAEDDDRSTSHLPCSYQLSVSLVVGNGADPRMRRILASRALIRTHWTRIHCRWRMLWSALLRASDLPHRLTVPAYVPLTNAFGEVSKVGKGLRPEFHQWGLARRLPSCRLDWRGVECSLRICWRTCQPECQWRGTHWPHRPSSSSSSRSS